jgi:hypothetical protein
MKRRSDVDQLDLFSQVPAAIIAFPLERMVGPMRRIAAELLELVDDEDARDRRWKSRIRPLRKQLLATGLPADEVEHQLRAFRAGVLCQARKQVILGIHRGDAA